MKTYRLTALSQNGYVSHYWYDADGERTVKMHGGNMAVFVNSRQDGRVLDTQQTTAYFSPYFSIHEGRFTKHLYIGSERIASMTGELKPGDVSNSPAGGYNISHAGYDSNDNRIFSLDCCSIVVFNDLFYSQH